MSLRVSVRSNRLAAIAKQAPSKMAQALNVEAEEIMTRSKRDFVPVDQGVLRGSGHVQPPEVNGGQVTVTMGYGGAASGYALVQHERVDYAHTVGQSKYLEQPVREAASGMAERVGRRLDLK